MLSAIAHGNEPDGLGVVMAVIMGLDGADEAAASVYRTLIYEALGEALRKKVEEMIMQAVPESREPPFVQKLKAIGRAEGEAKGLKAALFKLVARTGLALGEEERARIDECNDPAVLDRWLDNAFGAKTAEELFR